MPYTIEEHSHRLAAWDASRSASASPLCRFKVRTGVAILEASGFTPSFASVGQLPTPTDIDREHFAWRSTVIDVAGMQGLNFTHGIAAKLVNCYLKARFVCAGKHEHERVKCLHPPIDEVLLRGLARKDLGGHARRWRQFRQARWSKWDSITYQRVIDLIRDSLPPGEALWKIEEHWEGYQ